ncbi:MAG TPA: VCBS repeat-containing protein [Thermoanaerobaculia bacterium]|nr:VCBS repeat-containing protein [Thermoanaerobaculia bacterium]
MSSKTFSLSLFLILAATGAFARDPQAQTPQTPAAGSTAAQIDGGIPTWIRPETPEQRRARLGTNEDPGLDPDPKKIFHRFGRTYTIEKYDRRWESHDNVDDPGYVRPFGFVNAIFEIYQRNEKWVWVWVPTDLGKPLSEQQVAEGTLAGEAEVYTEPQMAYLKKIQPEFSPLEPPASNVTLRFEESSEGLPTSGSWRNALAVADMNNDGHADIIVPPQRGGGVQLPAIFLGDGKGKWKIWPTVIWPGEIQYGGVAAADFNKDGNMDLAFAVHLTGVRVWLGDGKGTFTDASDGLPLTDYPTRRVVAADLDADSWTDVLVISEGASPTRKIEVGKVRAFLNRNKGRKWEAVDAAAPRHILGGDWLTVGKFNRDKYADFAGASNYFQASELVYLSKGPKEWAPVSSDGEIVPYLSYYWGLTAGKFSSKQLDDLVMSYTRFWPDNVNPRKIPTPPITKVTGLDRITFTGKEPKRVPIMRFEGSRPTLGVGSADFDGDGNRDVIFDRYTPREFVLLLGDGKGNFSRAKLEGIRPDPNPNYDLTVADVNKDGRPDLLVMFESNSESRFGIQDGSIRVFLNRGKVAAAASK